MAHWGILDQRDERREELEGKNKKKKRMNILFSHLSKMN